LDTYSLDYYFLKNWFELPGHLPSKGRGEQKPFFGDRLWTLTNISLQRNMISTIGKKLVHLQRLDICTGR